MTSTYSNHQRGLGHPIFFLVRGKYILNSSLLMFQGFCFDCIKLSSHLSNLAMKKIERFLYWLKRCILKYSKINKTGSHGLMNSYMRGQERGGGSQFYCQWNRWLKKLTRAYMNMIQARVLRTFCYDCTGDVGRS